MAGANSLMVSRGEREVHIPRLMNESVLQLQTSSWWNGMGTEHWSWNENNQEINQHNRQHKVQTFVLLKSAIVKSD